MKIMHDIKTIDESQNKDILGYNTNNNNNNCYQKVHINNNNHKNNNSINISNKATDSSNNKNILINSTSTKIKSSLDIISSSDLESSSSTEENSMPTLIMRRRRIFQRRACLLSIMAAFSLGLTLGVFIPIIGMSAAFTSLPSSSSDILKDGTALLNRTGSSYVSPVYSPSIPRLVYNSSSINFKENNRNVEESLSIPKILSSDSLYTELRINNDNGPDQIMRDSSSSPLSSSSSSSSSPSPSLPSTFRVSFIKETKVPAEEVFKNAFHLEKSKYNENENIMIVKRFDSSDGSIREFTAERMNDGLFRKGAEKILSRPSVIAEQILIPTSSSISNYGNKDQSDDHISVEFVPVVESKNSKLNHHNLRNIGNQRYRSPSHISNRDNQFGAIEDDIYWGDVVERSLPKGFKHDDTKDWNDYVKMNPVSRLEMGCGRMQNRMVIFKDGTKACARYRQNTDQIQGELFSFYLGQLLNLTNLAPSAAAIVELETGKWLNAAQDITNAQWKSSRPIVLTKWLPDLEPAGIPTPFQPLERHLNKYDVWNITLRSNRGENESNIHPQQKSESSATSSSSSSLQKGLLNRLGAAAINDDDQSFKRSADINHAQRGKKYDEINIKQTVTIKFNSNSNNNNDNNNNYKQTEIERNRDNKNFPNLYNNQNKIINSNEKDNGEMAIKNATILKNLIELAQWSDLIVFDYLIANLDRVVNNLYNYQWNADIMAAPAHNLARQTSSQLLVFLDNESGLLHGYRLLKKYEAYHGLLLDNLCVFRKPTILALQNLRASGVGQKLQDYFENSTSHQVRDVLPSLPEKSIKILTDRIDRVLGQVQKCRDLFAAR